MYVGFIKCPNCDAPLDHDAFVCAYCHSTAPASAPWNRGAWTTFAAVLSVVGLLAAVDALFGTSIVPTLWDYLRRSQT